MALDFGVYEAFRQRPKIDREIAAKQQNVQYMQGIAQMAAQKQQKQLASQQAVAQSLATYDQIQALKRDKEGLVNLVQEEETKILEGIAKSGGDPYKYLNSGGHANLQQYHSAIQNSNELGTLIGNKQKQAAYMEALGKGEMPLPVAMEIDGKKQIVNFGDQLAMYENGQIDQLQWRGAQKPVKIDPLATLKIPNPDNPLRSRNVSSAEYQTMLIAGGQDPLLANMMTQSATVQGTNHTNLKFGVDSAAIRAAMKGRSKGPQVLDMYTNIPQYKKYVVGAKIGENLYNAKGEVSTFKNLQPGESGFYESYNKSNGGTSADNQVMSEVGVQRGKEGYNITMNPGDVFEVPGSNKIARISPNAGGMFNVQSAEVIMRSSGLIQRGPNGERFDNVDEGRSYVKLVMKMEDENAAALFTDMESGTPVYDIGTIFDNQAPGYERAIQEDGDDLTITLLKPIDYSSVAARETGRVEDLPAGNGLGGTGFSFGY